MGKQCCAREGSRDDMSRGHLLAKLIKEHYLQCWPGVVYNALSFDVAFLYKHPIAWISWHLKLIWSSLVAYVQTHAKRIVLARALMYIQTA